MQGDLASMLHQKSRLAALGLAVSKINHDLRNLLASAQLFSDGLSQSARSARAALRAEADALAGARHRAVPVDAVLRPRAGAAAGAASRSSSSRWSRRCARRWALADAAQIGWIVAIERGMMVDADHDQLLRVLLNLTRNAAQALETPRAERSAARPDPHHRPPRGRGGGDRGVGHRPGLPGEGARASVRGVPGLDPRPAAPASASPSRPS